MKVTNNHITSFPSVHEAQEYHSKDSRTYNQNSLPYSTSGLWFPPNISYSEFPSSSQSEKEQRAFLSQGVFTTKPQIRTSNDSTQEGKPDQLDVWVSSLDKRTSSPKLYERGLSKCSLPEGRRFLDLIELIGNEPSRCEDFKFPPTLYVFRSGISPIWHDQANIKGGRFTLVISLPFKKESLKKFNDLVQILNLFHSTPKNPKVSQETLNLLSERNIVSKERALFRREVVGVSLKFQETVNILSVWNKFAFNPNKLSSLTFVLSKLLGVSSARLRYRSHQESSGCQIGAENAPNIGSVAPTSPPKTIGSPPLSPSTPRILSSPPPASKPVSILNKKPPQQTPQSPPNMLKNPRPHEYREFRREENFLDEKYLAQPSEMGTTNAGSSSPPTSWSTCSEYSLWSDDQDLFSREFQSRRNSDEVILPEVEEDEKEQNDEILYLYQYYSTLAQQEKHSPKQKRNSKDEVTFLPLITSISCFPIVDEQIEPPQREWSNDLNTLRRATTRQLRNRLEVLQLVENYYTITSKMSV